MEDQTYRFEKYISFFAIFTIVIVIITALNFFEVINFEKWKGTYCISSTEDIKCSNLQITFNQVKFDLTYNKIDIESIKVISGNPACNIKEITSITRNQANKIILDCSLTDSKGSSYSDIIKIEYKERNKINSKNTLFEIKSRVE